MGRTFETTHDLVGAMFSTPKELRHLAEREFCQTYVATEVLSEDGHSTLIELRPGGMCPLRVHAERARHWYPYRITRIEVADLRNGAAA
jgi:hypothetical protein